MSTDSCNVNDYAHRICGAAETMIVDLLRDRVEL